MTFGRLIAWNPETQRGIIEDRLGNTYKAERKDFLELEAIRQDIDLSFEVWDGERAAYAVQVNSSEFLRYQEAVGRFIP